MLKMQPYVNVESVNDLKMQKKGKFSVTYIISLMDEPKKGIIEVATTCFLFPVCSTMVQRLSLGSLVLLT
jgi:hypothetical protein